MRVIVIDDSNRCFEYEYHKKEYKLELTPEKVDIKSDKPFFIRTRENYETPAWMKNSILEN